MLTFVVLPCAIGHSVKQSKCQNPKWELYIPDCKSTVCIYVSYNIAYFYFIFFTALESLCISDNRGINSPPL